MPEAEPQLKLNGFKFQELFTSDGLKRLDEVFLQGLEMDDNALWLSLKAYRETDVAFAAEAYSDFLIALATRLEPFLIRLFGIESEAAALKQIIIEQDPIFIFKHHFVAREGKRLLKHADTLPPFAELDRWLTEELPTHPADRELAVAHYAQTVLQNTAIYHEAIEKLTAWCAQALATPEGQLAVKGWVSFKLPEKLSFEHLVGVEPVSDDCVDCLQGHPEHYRARDGFALTDTRMTERQALSEVDYCVYCHTHDGDFCSKGFPVKKTQPELGLKTDPLGEVLTGCPLEEKISEMNWLKKYGHNLAALAMVMLDNPMCPATGHRICNDCMKACIYQKQDPVNIPEIETRVLTDVLSLPWGVEIYDLLTRWNPLRRDQYVMQPYNGLKVLIMGMGPAGFTMAHHLLMAGFAVVGADGLKIEPLPERYITQPIYSYHTLEEPLDNRVMSGFGGVAEYGITVRWDKNFLKLIYITLMRRPYFQVFGSLRFGGTITVDEAWRLGFDHVTLAVGAGLPSVLAIPNSLAPGMRQANDFLMTLQLTGAAKESSLANLQVRLPAVVIGGGLTGVDTATEVQAYYIKQVEKTLFRYETLASRLGEETLRAEFSAQDLEVLDEFCAHARIVRQERAQALDESRAPNFIKLIREWGGVTIVYRRSMQESPAYKRNPEELQKAFEEGIYYAEQLEPLSVEVDQYGCCVYLHCKSHLQADELRLPARAIFVATGAKPNVAYAFEHKDDILRKKFEYPRYREEHGELIPVPETGHVKMKEAGVFTSYAKDGHFVSFIGDTHPIFHGSVVKAVASAKIAYPYIVKAMQLPGSPGEYPEDDGRGSSVNAQSLRAAEYAKFSEQLADTLSVTVTSLESVADDVMKLTVRAPQLAHMFKPGQFYRLQPYETSFTVGSVEGVPCLGFKTDPDSDELSFLIVNRGVSSALLLQSYVGQSLAIMGPTGVRTSIPHDQQAILIVGNQLAIPYLLSVGPALKAAGNHVYFNYHGDHLFCEREIRAIVDDIVISTVDFGSIPLGDINQVHIIGDATLLRAMRCARTGVLADKLRPDVEFKASVYGPMQCMLKGVCAQCLQWQIDPSTGERTKAVYACSWQHQPMELIDIDNLDERLVQNKMQERLTELFFAS